jgi:hypothetical protein
LDALVKGARELGLVETVEKEGDMDMQWRIIKDLLTNPRAFRLGLRVVRRLSPLLKNSFMWPTRR